MLVEEVSEDDATMESLEESDEEVLDEEAFAVPLVETAEALAEQLLGNVPRESFTAVDSFVPSRCRDCAFDDSPLRARDECSGCVVHLSAPSIYATALEALALSPGLSFLNVGSGSGYLSALAATTLTARSVHHCVERCPALAARSRDALARYPETRHVIVHAASIFDLDPDASIRYDRIYCGAGALASDARFLSSFLKPGGVLVGPFEDDDLLPARRASRRFRHGRPQCLVRATLTNADLLVEDLMPVQFTPLARDPPNPRLALRGPTWGFDPPDLFPPDFRLAVALLSRGAASSALNNKPARQPPLRAVPWHVWESRILTFLAYDDILLETSPHDKHTPPDAGLHPASPTRGLLLAHA